MNKLSTLFLRLVIIIMMCTRIIPVHAQSPWIINENFSTNENKWFISNDSFTNASLSGNAYHISAVGSQAVTITKKFSLDQTHDFKIEAEFELISADSMGHGFGISFGMAESGKEGYEFLITENGIYVITQHTLTGSTEIEKPKEVKHIINSGRFKKNKLTITNREGYWGFFINDVSVRTSKPYPFAGDRFGFFVTQGMKVIVHSFKIYDWTLAKGLPATQKEPIVSTKLFDNFFDNRNDWHMKGGANTDISINKKYTFNNKTDGYHFSWKYSDIFGWGDYLIEMEFQHESGVNDWGYGFTFGLKDMDNHYGFVIADGAYKIHKWEKDELTNYVNWTDDDMIRKGDLKPNVLRLMKIGNEWRFYVNGKLLTTLPAKPLFDRYFGIVVQEKQKISLNYIKTAILHYPKD